MMSPWKWQGQGQEKGRVVGYNEGKSWPQVGPGEKGMAYFLGVDIGSALSKAMVIDEEEIRGSNACPSGGGFRAAAERVKGELLSKLGLSQGDIARSAATGYGSGQASYAQERITDMTCHGRGVALLFPSVRTIVDVGDLSSKAFRIDERGNLLNFLNSGKCAGGSGRILKVVAKVLQTGIEELGALSLEAGERVEFSTGCAVFAETEVISRVAEGVPKENIIAGLHWALASQLNSLAERIGIERDYALVGGGARDKGLVKALEEINRFAVIVPPEPHMTSALGAALIARDHYYRNGDSVRSFRDSAE